MDKKRARLRRAVKPRAKIKELGFIRLVVNRTPCHIYAQLISPDGKVIAAVSTLQQEIKAMAKSGGNIAAAKVVGKKIAELGMQAGVTKVAFDRSGFKYHGRVKALADSAREQGLDF